jgi:tetratricopeptide (TPR) repeat protein
VAKKFSVLANLDLDSIQSEREIKVKKQIIGNRLKRNYFQFQSKFIKIFRPLGIFLSDFFKNSYQKALDFKENYNKNEAKPENPEDIDSLFLQVDEFLKEENLEEAEKIYIKIIGINSKSIKAFRGLGKLYFEKKDYREGKQTLEHAVKLLEKDLNELSLSQEENEEGSKQKEELNSFLSLSYYDLFLIAKTLDDNKESLVNINKALSIEPNNPRFLDTKLEISIIEKDKVSARETFEKLKEVNPENSKLEELEGRIQEI